VSSHIKYYVITQILFQNGAQGYTLSIFTGKQHGEIGESAGSAEVISRRLDVQHCSL
jgi:hypothetical protein